MERCCRRTDAIITITLFLLYDFPTTQTAHQGREFQWHAKKGIGSEGLESSHVVVSALVACSCIGDDRFRRSKRQVVGIKIFIIIIVVGQILRLRCCKRRHRGDVVCQAMDHGNVPCFRPPVLGIGRL